MPRDAQYWIDTLGLLPHPEGGFYRETYRSAEVIPQSGLPERFDSPRCFSTAIYFLLPSPHVSALHRIQQDELWHFHVGSALNLHVLAGSNAYESIRLGPDPDAAHVLQATVPAGAVFGAEVTGAGAYALLSCTVAPGFEFNDFDMPSRADLLARFPERAELIHRLTRD